MKDVKDDTSGDFRRMFVSILQVCNYYNYTMILNYNYLQASRDESATVDETLARADAQALYDVR